MEESPKICALTLCRQLGLDPQSGPSLLGVFQSLRFPSFPSPNLSFSVYALLYDHVGQGTVLLTITDPRSETDILRLERQVIFPDLSVPVNLELKIDSCLSQARKVPAKPVVRGAETDDALSRSFRELKLMRTTDQSFGSDSVSGMKHVPADAIDRCVANFEKAWRDGQEGRIEDYLGLVPERMRELLFERLLKSELKLFDGREDFRSLKSYLGRFPERQEAVRSVFHAHFDMPNVPSELQNGIWVRLESAEADRILRPTCLTAEMLAEARRTSK